MSHRTTIRSKVKSLTALATAVSTFKGAKMSKPKNGFATISVAGAYSTISVELDEKGGTYSMIGNLADDPTLRVFSRGGYDDMNRLLKAYSKAVVEEESAKKGLRIKETTAKNGEVTMKLTGGKLTEAKYVNAKLANDGTVELDAIGFEGEECQAETKFLEDKLGIKTGCQCKPEMAKKPKVRIKA